MGKLSAPPPPPPLPQEISEKVNMIKQTHLTFIEHLLFARLRAPVWMHLHNQLYKAVIHFTEMQIEAQRAKVTCPRFYSW